MSDKIEVSGVVEKVSNHIESGTWAIVVDNIRYGLYKTKPNCNVGDNVAFSATQKGQYWNADAKSIRVLGTSPKAAAPAAPAPRTSAWVPDKDRQDSIIYQSARKDALEFVSLLITSGGIDVSKLKSVASKASALEVFLDKYTQRFFQDTKDLGHNEKPTSPPESDTFVEDDDIPF